MALRIARAAAGVSIVAAAVAVWPCVAILRADPNGLDARLLWVLVPLFSAAGALVALRHPALPAIWVLAGVSFGFVILAAWSFGLFFAPSALSLLIVALAQLARTRAGWRLLLIPAWFAAGATTVCVLLVLRDLALSNGQAIATAPIVVAGARISVGLWTLLILTAIPSWLRTEDRPSQLGDSSSSGPV